MALLKEALPVLPRLDRLDRLLELLEERQKLKSSSSSDDDHHQASLGWSENKQPITSMTIGGGNKSMCCALEEVRHKGSIIDRLETLERRFLQLSIEMEVGNYSSRTSSSSVMALAAQQTEESTSNNNNNTDKAATSSQSPEEAVSLQQLELMKNSRRPTTTKPRPKTNKWPRCFRLNAS